MEIDSFLWVCASIFVYMTVGFIISVLRKRNDIADILWGIGFIVAMLVATLLQDVFTTRMLLLGILVSLWGIRLAIHIGTRNKGKKEDFRYAQWRKDWGKWFLLRSYAQVFLLQGLLLVVVVSPVILNAMYDAAWKWSWLDSLGLVIWMIGFFFEAVGDYQLRSFLATNKKAGTIMQSGLWRYTRHPNYFGEVTLWWGIGIIAFSGTGMVLSFVGPVVISYLILFVSGVPLLEKKYAGNAAFEAYKKKTSVFFPLPPKK